MTGAQPGGSLMTCGQLTLSQLIRLLFSARLPFLSSFRLPSFLGSSFSRFLRLPPPRSLSLIHTPTWPHLPAPPPYLRYVSSDEGSRVGGNLFFEGCFCALRKKTTDRSSLDRSEARGVVFSCALRTVCVLVFVCGESSALSLVICFPGGPTGASPASRGAPDSSGICTTGLAGLPGESSSHVSASSSSASTFFFSPLFVCCFVSEDLFRARHTFCHFPSCSFSPFFVLFQAVLVSLLLIQSVNFCFALALAKFFFM